MALLIKSAINYCHLTARAKHSIVPQLTAAFTARSSYSTKSSVAAMLEHEVVPDVIPVAPSDKIEVICFSIVKLYDVNTLYSYSFALYGLLTWQI